MKNTVISIISICAVLAIFIIPIIYGIITLTYIRTLSSLNDDYIALEVYMDMGGWGYRGEVYVINKKGFIPKIKDTAYDAPASIKWLDNNTLYIDNKYSFDGIINCDSMFECNYDDITEGLFESIYGYNESKNSRYDLPSIYELWKTDSFEYRIVEPCYYGNEKVGTTVIPNVIEVCCNDNFIGAKVGNFENYIQGKEGILAYYIIDTEKMKVYGPFNLEERFKACKDTINSVNIGEWIRADEFD